MTITELEARATARVLGRTMVEPCDAITVRVLCSRLREAIRTLHCVRLDGRHRCLRPTASDCLCDCVHCLLASRIEADL